MQYTLGNTPGSYYGYTYSGLNVDPSRSFVQAQAAYQAEFDGSSQANVPAASGLLDQLLMAHEKLFAQVVSINKELSIFRGQVLGSYDPPEGTEKQATDKPRSSIERLTNTIHLLARALATASRQAADIRRLG